RDVHVRRHWLRLGLHHPRRRRHHHRLALDSLVVVLRRAPPLSKPVRCQGGGQVDLDERRKSCIESISPS
ncbi:uncharacterized protein RHOBADRAFT_51176, partial [Rhodotorula graminis WP1]